MINVTDAARNKLKEVLNNNPGKHLRIFIEGYGWGGPNLGLTLDEPKKNENQIQTNGIDFLVTDDVKDYAERSTIDYINEGYQESFTIGVGKNKCC